MYSTVSSINSTQGRNNEIFIKMSIITEAQPWIVLWFLYFISLVNSFMFCIWARQIQTVFLHCLLYSIHLYLLLFYIIELYISKHGYLWFCWKMSYNMIISTVFLTLDFVMYLEDKNKKYGFLCFLQKFF